MNDITSSLLKRRKYMIFRQHHDFKENHLFSLNKPHKFDYNKISLIEIPKNLSKSLKVENGLFIV